MARKNSTLQYDDRPTGPDRPNPFTDSSEVDISGGDKAARAPIEVNPDGYIKIERPDGSVVIDFSGRDKDKTAEPLHGGFNRNLAADMDEQELNSVVADLIEGIEADEQSRKEWMDIRRDGMKMLALKVEEPKSSTALADMTAPLEGMSNVRHSILLEAVIAFQAGARGELLPAAGPVKVKNSGPPNPPPQAAVVDGTEPNDELAVALEADFNFYLTNTASEYVPDTDRMYFLIAYGGDGFKKLYHCPLRRRPVSESIEAQDLIVSNAATDLGSCGRVTHRIKMRKSVLRRMQLSNAYLDIDLPRQPEVRPANEVEQEKAAVGGYKTQPVRPKDADYDVLECYCELDLPQFAPKHLRDSGLPLPFKVTIERTSRKCLELRRNWKRNDRECNAKKVFVQFPFIRGLGFYGLGFVHLLGNSVMALTAAYRLMLDAGMMANFPGMVGDKQMLRQLDNNMRIPPGGFKGVDLPSGKRIQDVMMAVPYKEVGPAFPAFIQHLEDRTKQLAMVSNSSVGEGKQDAPVGTTLALLEQATKVEASAFKRLHDAHAEEFKVLKELFREDPEALWRHAKGTNPSGYQWQKAQFLQALEKYELTPVSDPNNPTALHRMMKSAMVKMLAMQNPQAYDMIAVDKRIMSMANIDPQGLFRPPPPPGAQPPDPIQQALAAKTQMMQLQVQLKQQEQQLKAAIAIQTEQGKAADRASRERIEKMKVAIERTMNERDHLLERLKMTHEGISKLMDHGREMQSEQHDIRMRTHDQQLKVHDQQHKHGLAEQDQQHRQGLERQQFVHQLHTDQQAGMREDRGFGHQQQMDWAGHAQRGQEIKQPKPDDQS
jgi:hypothetical protein